MKKFQIFFVLFFIASCSSANDGYTFRSYTHEEFDYVKEAHTFLGYDEKRERREIRDLTGIDPVRTEWCAAFVNAILKIQGVPGSESVSDYPLTARSFLKWGEEVDQPRIGDIVVFPRGNSSWQGHVGFYIETRTIRDIDYYVILGGNQNDSVSYDLYPAYKALSIRRTQS